MGDLGLPSRHSGKVSACQSRKSKRHGFDPWSVRSPEVGNGSPLHFFWPGESQGQRILAGYSPYGNKESDTIEHTHTNREINILFSHLANYWKRSAHFQDWTIFKRVKGCNKLVKVEYSTHARADSSCPCLWTFTEIHSEPLSSYSCPKPKYLIETAFLHKTNSVSLFFH